MTRKEFKQLLKDHDWYYQMSSDPRWVKAGEEQESAIKAEIRKEPKFQKVYDTEFRIKFPKI